LLHFSNKVTVNYTVVKCDLSHKEGIEIIVSELLVQPLNSLSKTNSVHCTLLNFSGVCQHCCGCKYNILFPSELFREQIKAL
jgi:hypothetical protein